MKNITYYLCIGCGKLHCSSECADCSGCANKVACLDALNGSNKEFLGMCHDCLREREVVDAVAA